MEPITTFFRCHFKSPPKSPVEEVHCSVKYTFLVGKVVRPVKELKGFQKIFLKKGESKTVSFNITPEDLKFYDDELNFDWESGEFDIMIGTNSAQVQTKRVNWEK